MSVFFLSNNNGSDQHRELEARLKASIPDLTRIGSLSDIPSAMRGSPGNPITILFAGPTNDTKYLDNLVSIAARNREAIFFILISDAIDTNDYKRLRDTGSAEWVSTAGAPQEILDILRRSRRPQPAREGATSEPTVITFVPSAGGVGNSKLIAEIGVWLKTTKATKSRRIALIDLDFQTSHVCSYLDIEPKFRVEEIAEDPDRLDSQLFDIFRSQHASGLDVIAAPRSKFNANDLAVDALNVLFDAAATRYDLILIDLPVIWFSWTKDIVANSDALVVTGINTIPCLHQIAETLSAIRSSRADAPPISVVINRCESTMLGGIAREKHVHRALGQEKVFYIRDNPAAMAQTVNAGTTLVSGYGSRKIVSEIAPLARYCADVKSLRSAGAQPSIARKEQRQKAGKAGSSR